MDKDSQQMKNSVRAELGRNQEGRTISHVSRTRVCNELTTFMRPNRDLIMKNVGDKDDSKSR